MQLVELQDAWQNLQRKRVAIFAISYDSVEVLAEFAEKRRISYPLLSDEGSHTIRAFGLLNEQHLVQQHAFYGIQTREEQLGVAYPGTLVLNAQGVISDKYFEQSYRVRPTARIFEEYALGKSTAASPPKDAPRATGRGLEVRVWTDARTYRPYQQVRLHVHLVVAPDMHVFAPSGAEEITPLSLQMEPLDGLEVGQPALPAPRRLGFKGLEEQFLVYEGSIRGMIPLRFTKNLGPSALTLHVKYQACTSTLCFPPTTLRVAVSLDGLDLIRD